MAGALSTAFVANKFGRKGGLLYNNVLVLLASACLGFCKMAKSYELLILGRFFIGVNSGSYALFPAQISLFRLQD